jgi:uncharacterized protein
MEYLICMLLISCALAMISKAEEPERKVSNSFAEVLESKGRSPEIDSDVDVYGWLIGNWKIHAIDYSKNGTKTETPAEWHFARVLEGRAIQDVFIVPVRSTRSSSTSKERNRYGTTLRYYDSNIHAWILTWTNPVQNVQKHLIARKVGSEIIQEGKSENGELMRWTFRDITPNSFRWTGEESPDQGISWHLGVELFATRMDKEK